MLIIATLATLIGVSLGLLGGGGSILAVPLLAYVAQVPAKEAIATSLIVVGGTAAISLIQHARRRRGVRTGAVFAAAMLGALVEGERRILLGSTLLLLFAAMMIVTAAAMFASARADRLRRANGTLRLDHGRGCGRRCCDRARGRWRWLWSSLPWSCSAVCPFTRLWGPRCSSSPQIFRWIWGYAGHVTIDLELTATVTVAAMVGSLVELTTLKRSRRSGFAKGLRSLFC